MIIKTYDYKGEKIEIDVTTNGYFYAYHDGDHDQPIAKGPRLDTVEEQVAKIIRSYKRIRVDIPFTTRDFKQATCTGRHANTGHFLIKVLNPETGKMESSTLYRYNNKVFKPLSEKALEERQKIEALKQKVFTMLTKWEDKHTFDLAAALNDAIHHEENRRS